MFQDIVSFDHFPYRAWHSNCCLKRMKANYVNIDQLLLQAKKAEEEKDYTLAVKLYEKVIKSNPMSEIAFNRLMIIYRKLKSYQDELRIIDKGIRNFREFYSKRKSNAASNKSSVKRLSLQLMKTTGLTNKKGIPNYEPQPIAKWQRRREIAETKL